MKKAITFMGKEISVAFNMRAQLEYEKLYNQAFDLKAVSENREEQFKVYVACIKACNPESDITVDTLLDEASFADLNVLDTALGELMADFYHIPATVKKDAPQEEGEEQPNP